MGMGLQLLQAVALNLSWSAPGCRVDVVAQSRAEESMSKESQVGSNLGIGLETLHSILRTEYKLTVSHRSRAGWCMSDVRHKL